MTTAELSYSAGFWQNTRRSFANTLKRDGFGFIALIILGLVILGPGALPQPGLSGGRTMERIAVVGQRA